MKKWVKNKLSFFIGPLILLILWTFLSYSNFIDQFLFPWPIETLNKTIKLLSDGVISTDIKSTLIRVGLSFFIAAIIGWPIGLLFGMSKHLYKHTEFVIDFFRSIPATAFFPLFMLIFGIKDTTKIAVASFSSAIIIIFHTAYGVAHKNKTRMLAAKIMGANKWQIFHKIIFWESLPHTIVSFRYAISLSLVVIIVTEMFIGTNSGIGKKIIDFQFIYDIKGVYVMIFLTGIIGYFLNKGISILESHVIHWSKN